MTDLLLSIALLVGLPAGLVIVCRAVGLTQREED